MRRRAAHVWLTFTKELRETLRDRRTLAVMILFPLVVYPVLSLLVAQTMASKSRRQEEHPSRVALVGPPEAVKELQQRLARDPKAFSLIAGDRASEGQIREGQLDALVRVEAAATRAKLELVFDGTSDESRQAEDRLGDALACALPATCAPRYALARRDLASKTQIGAYMLSKALPLVIVLMVLLGAFYPAIDVTAGERERGTLETILAAPIRRTDLLLGKVLAVTVLATVTGVLNLTSMSATLVQMVRIAEPGTMLPIPWRRAAATALIIPPCGFLFGALFVAIGSLARGFKEAQNLLLPVYFLFFAPAIVGTLGETRLAGTALLIPGMNVTLLARDIALGKAGLLPALAVLGATLAFGLVALTFAARLYASERFVDGPSGAELLRSALSGGAPGAPATTPPPTAGEALSLFAIGYLLLYFVFIPLEREHLAAGLVVAQWGGLLGLVALYARLTKRRLRDVLAWRRPRPGALLAGLLVGLSGWIVVGLLTEWVLPPPKEVVEHLRHTVAGVGGRGLLPTLLLVAVTPALCEEAFFRGAILRGLGTRLSPLGAIVVTALLFGLFHIDLWRLLPTALLGLLLGLLAWRSGSLLPSALAHLLNNGALVTLAHLGVDDRIEALSRRAQAGLFVAALALLALAVLALERSARSAKM